MPQLNRREFLTYFGASAASLLANEVVGKIGLKERSEAARANAGAKPSPTPEPSLTPETTPTPLLVEQLRTSHPEMLLTEPIPKEKMLASDEKTYCLNCSFLTVTEVQQLIKSSNQKWNVSPTPEWNKYLPVSDGQPEKMSAAFVQEKNYADFRDQYRAGYISSIEIINHKELLVIRLINIEHQAHYLLVFDMTQDDPQLQVYSDFAVASSAEGFLTNGTKKPRGSAQNLLFIESVHQAKDELRKRVGYQVLERFHHSFPNIGWWGKENRYQIYGDHFQGIIDAMDNGAKLPFVDPNMVPYFDDQMTILGAGITFVK
jgi:hypothetical protein